MMGLKIQFKLLGQLAERESKLMRNRPTLTPVLVKFNLFLLIPISEILICSHLVRHMGWWAVLIWMLTWPRPVWILIILSVNHLNLKWWAIRCSACPTSRQYPSISTVSEILKIFWSNSFFNTLNYANYSSKITRISNHLKLEKFGKADLRFFLGTINFDSCSSYPKSSHYETISEIFWLSSLPIDYVSLMWRESSFFVLLELVFFFIITIDETCL